MILSAEPDGEKSVVRYLGEALSFRLVLKVPARLKGGTGLPPLVEAEVETNLVDSQNPNGEWVARKMVAEVQPSTPGSRSWKRPESEAPTLSLTFFVVLVPTTLGKYYFRMRARTNNPQSDKVSAYQYFGGQEDKNFKIKILHPDPDSQTWNSGPIAAEIHPNIYVGNFLMACDAQKHGFTAILNCAEELDLPLEHFTAPLPTYKKIGLVDGTANPISQENILAAVRWLEARDGSKILIHCRAGLGRSGSIGIAYKSKKAPMLSYDDVMSLIWKAKPDITPHKGLRQTLESIKWD